MLFGGETLISYLQLPRIRETSQTTLEIWNRQLRKFRHLVVNTENNPENEIPVDVQEQNGPPEPDQRAEKVEPEEKPDERRHPSRIRQEPVRLGFN